MHVPWKSRCCLSLASQLEYLTRHIRLVIRVHYASLYLGITRQHKRLRSWDALNHVTCDFSTSHNHTNYTGGNAGNDVLHAAQRAKCRYSVTLPAETYEIRVGKPLLTLSLKKPSYNAEATLKNCELFIYGDVLHYVKGHEVAKSVEALRNKLEVRGFDSVIRIFHWYNPSGSTQPLTEMSTRNIT